VATAKQALQAFPAWADTAVDERATYCSRIAEGLAARMDEIATLVSEAVGMVKRACSASASDGGARRRPGVRAAKQA
jgi:acyl-CoA reductase-like NAD-dependent aldehyde dehydrogenase